MSIAIAQRVRRQDASPEQATASSWRYLPLAVLVTSGTVVAPIASVELFQELTNEGSILISLLVAVCLSVAIATAGSALWQRRPGSTDILFGDLMLWGWVRRMRTERKLAKTTALLGGHSTDRDRRVEILEELARALDARDPYTHGHSQRVARNAHMIATNLGLPAKQIAKIRVAAAVHDVGKLNTDRSILNKPGALTDAEYATIKLHPGDGADMLASLGDPEIVAMVRHHHERLDGSGYPDGLVGDEIPIGARIIAVADTFDAITSARPYRKPREHHVALSILKQEAGTALDADAVAAFQTYYTGRKSAAWSSLALAGPERLLGLLSGGAGPIAQGAAATVAAASVGGALVHPVLDVQPHARTAATVQHVSQGTPAGTRASLPAGGDRSRVAGSRAHPGASPQAEGKARGDGSRSGPTESTQTQVRTESDAGAHNGVAYGKTKPDKSNGNSDAHGKPLSPPGQSKAAPGTGNAHAHNQGTGHGNTGSANPGKVQSKPANPGISGSSPDAAPAPPSATTKTKGGKPSG